MFINIVGVEHIGAYKLRLQFDNGVEKDVDLSTELNDEIHRPLKDVEYFRKVYIDPDTNSIEWPNGAEFTSEFLYEIGRELHRSNG